MSAQLRQTQQDREYILSNLPDGVRRVQVLDHTGKQAYKRPEDIDVLRDEIVLSSDGTPVVMRGRPGRKPKTQLVATTPQIAEVAKARSEHIEHDPLRREAKKDSDGDAVIGQVIVAMAEEAAAIEFERDEAARHGLDTSNHSTKRARILKGMADTWIKRKQILEGGMVDLESPAFGVLFSYLLETFKEVLADAGVRSEQIETTFSGLVTVLGEEAWKEEAKARMKDKLR
jgi:hypothetical protein